MFEQISESFRLAVSKIRFVDDEKALNNALDGTDCPALGAGRSSISDWVRYPGLPPLGFCVGLPSTRRLRRTSNQTARTSNSSPDVDLSRTARILADFGYFNAGQDCTAVTRVLVQDSVYEQFRDLLVAEKFKR